MHAGDTDAPDDAESEDGFGGFEEADARSPAESNPAESNRGDDEDEVKPEALSSSESNTPTLIPALSAAGSSADIFTTGRADFLAQVRSLSSNVLREFVSGHFSILLKGAQLLLCTAYRHRSKA